MKSLFTLLKSVCCRLAGLALLAVACAPSESDLVVEGERIRIEFNDQLHSRIVSKQGNREIVLGEFTPSEALKVGNELLTDFTFDRRRNRKVNDAIGRGRQVTLVGQHQDLTKTVNITLYEDYPALAVYQLTYTNNGESALAVTGWVNHSYLIPSGPTIPDQPPFWSYNSASHRDRRDWLQPVVEGFSQANYLGMNASDYGGGTPVLDVWRPDAGVAVGHLEMVAKLISLPVSHTEQGQASIAVTYDKSIDLQPGSSLETFRTFVRVHEGDYYQSLATYRRLMVAQGVQFREPPATSYEPVWCAWGYGRGFTMEQVYGALPKAKELGFQWAVLDDGWQTAEGDWFLLPDKYPRGDADMKAFVDRIHAEGMKAKLWWAPLAADPGTDLLETHPEYLLLGEDGSPQRISYWNAFYLCPAYPPVVEHTKQLINTMMQVWGYDGFKLDGQHLNGVAPCYNPAHNHAYPEESVEQLADYFREFLETTLSLKPEAVVEICPCGASFTFFSLPYMNQSVSSDPRSSWQIRHKGKTLKALSGNKVPYYGDHVELSDGREDFATTVGIGGVIGTKFTWPVGSYVPRRAGRGSNDLTPEKEAKWAKWIRIYNDKMLPLGVYRGELYDIGFDRPEAHAISKDGRMYYAFYAEGEKNERGRVVAPGHYSGQVELRGLGDKTCRVYDYVNERDLGTVTGPVGNLEVDFEGYLLLETVPR